MCLVNVHVNVGENRICVCFGFLVFAYIYARLCMYLNQDCFIRWFGLLLINVSE